jgi:hypothetical protein
MKPEQAGGASPAPSEEQPIVEVAQAAEAAPAEADAKPAESSPADEKDAKPRSLADVVRDVVEPKTAPEETSAPGGEQGKTEGEAAEAPKGDEAKQEPEDDSKLPFHTHPRFQQLIHERNELKPQANRSGKSQTFMEFHGLCPGRGRRRLRNHGSAEERRSCPAP